MSFRTRLLVCGYEPEQGLGEPDYEEERWWVHAAAFSAQGPYSLPWWPVPPDTVKGDLFVLRLAAFEVPPAVRAELADGQIEIGTGAAGVLAKEAMDYSGFPLFGSQPGERRITLPDHPEFDPSREILGDGLVGLAVAHSTAWPLTGLDGLYEALVGTFVPFPDVVGVQEAARNLGPPFDDLETPMKQRTPDQVDLEAGQYEALIDLVLRLFPGDEELQDAILRLREVAARLGQPVSYYPPRLGPRPRFPGRKGGREATAAPGKAGKDFVSSGFWGPGPELEVSPSPEPSSQPESVAGEGRADEPAQPLAGDTVNGIIGDLLGALAGWAASDRSPADEPVELEQIAVDDGSERHYFEIPDAVAAEISLPGRFARLLKVQLDFSPYPSVALFVQDRSVFLFAIAVLEEGEPPVGRAFRLDIPPPGEQLGPLEDFDPSPGPPDSRADGPYGAEAMGIAGQARSDLLEKLGNWAAGERTGKDLPFETILYDSGELWTRREIPPTELKRPSLEDRFRELFPLFVEAAPAPSAGCFIHRRKLYVVMLACQEPGKVTCNLVRFDIPPPGEGFGPPEDVDIPNFSL